MKRCRTCKTVKPKTEFYASARGKCKDCTKRANKARKAKYRALPHDLTPAQWLEILAYWEDTCAYCGAVGQRLTKDCVVPQRHKGCYTRNNVVPACKRCNSSKAGKNVWRWLGARQFVDVERFRAKWKVWCEK